jgi:hypothetical protein
MAVAECMERVYHNRDRKNFRDLMFSQIAFIMDKMPGCDVNYFPGYYLCI